MPYVDEEFRKRCWDEEDERPDDERDVYQRDRARIIHSSAFRRLQAKTQVMGVGEGDFHRTRLTHSIEVAQIGDGLLNWFKSEKHNHILDNEKNEILSWLPSDDLLSAACLAHDLGHPPFGHAGEEALHAHMAKCGGFEGNGQTLRIVTRLEKYKLHKGMNPTRRLVLALLKYPASYSNYDVKFYSSKPPKCYFDTESQIVNWALGPPFDKNEVKKFSSIDADEGKPMYRTLDCSIMEAADDIAFAVHDLEDIVARGMVNQSILCENLDKLFGGEDCKIGVGDKGISLSEFGNEFFDDSYKRKETIGRLVNLFVTSSKIKRRPQFSHPLLSYYVDFDEPIRNLLIGLRKLTYELVIERAEIQQLERRGKRIVESLFEEFLQAPSELVPRDSWAKGDSTDSVKRRICDYIAGMTDSYAEKIYARLFIPGYGSSRDEL